MCVCLMRHNGKRHIYNISYHQGSEVTMLKTRQIQPMDETKEIKEIPSNETFGIHEFIHDGNVRSNACI